MPHFTNIDADETVAGNQDFAFISTAAFTAPGQINWFSNGTDTFIQFNTDADLAADGMIQLSGVVSAIGLDVPVSFGRSNIGQLPALPKQRLHRIPPSVAVQKSAPLPQ